MSEYSRIRHLKSFAIAAIHFLGAPHAHAQESPLPSSKLEQEREIRVGARFDCLHEFNRDKGANQDCITLTSLRFSIFQRLNPELSARLRLDPQGVLDPGREDLPDRSDLASLRDAELDWIDDYAFIWTPRTPLEVGLENYRGATRLPRVTSLALENPFDDPGWKQTALTATYKLALLPDFKVRFAAGNGEGEDGRNIDPQQYFGLNLSANLIAGLGAHIGVSQDGNSMGSTQYRWLAKRYQANCGLKMGKDSAQVGYQAQRVSGVLTFDGQSTGFPGLKLAFKGQRSILKDLDKSKTAYFLASDLSTCDQLDPNYLFVESVPGEAANVFQNTLLGFAGAYSLAGGYVLAASYSAKTIDSQHLKFFETCDAYASRICVTPSEKRAKYNKLSEDALSVGAGFQPARGLGLMMEYARLRYDRRYAKFFFQEQKEKTSNTRELFNLRISYDLL